MQSQKLFPFTETPDRIRALTGGKKKPHIATCHRWKQKGICGIKLRTISIGGTRCTSDEWLMEFFEATTAAKDKSTGESMRAGRLSAARELAIERAEAELDDAGIGGAK